MLNYLVETTQRLAAAMLIVGLMLGYVRAALDGRGKSLLIMRVGLIVGVVGALVMTWFKTQTNLVNTGTWNLRLYAVSLVGFIMFLVVRPFEKKRVGATLISVALSIEAAALLAYTLPFVMEMPSEIMFAQDSMLSSAFLYRIIGVIFGVILAFVACVSVCKEASRYHKNLSFALIVAALLINTLKQIAASLSILMAKRIIATTNASLLNISTDTYATLFNISKYASNFSDWFTYAVMIVALVLPVTILIAGAHVNEPYTNNAERRRIIAKWCNLRRWSVTTIVCVALSVFIMTYVSAAANQEVELSPIEDAKVEDGCVYVAFDQVNDGHLHRFGYTTESGTVIRFIVIQKPNSSAYGVGLDACDICGETGYYEKDGQVVCNLCDVVMNINTIGFKGGCNPIVIDYRIENGYIIVPVEGLVEYESEFK